MNAVQGVQIYQLLRAVANVPHETSVTAVRPLIAVRLHRLHSKYYRFAITVYGTSHGEDIGSTKNSHKISVFTIIPTPGFVSYCVQTKRVVIFEYLLLI